MRVKKHIPAIIGVGGFASNSGKTSLVCELLRASPAPCEAIKVTRGHYRSCGKDAHACCVSPLLGAQPLVMSERKATFQTGKDTGRFWDAGAREVHWVVATDEQIEPGVNRALNKVATSSVIIEGTSFAQYFQPDFFILCAAIGGRQIKPSARAALPQAQAIYLFDETQASTSPTARAEFENWLREKVCGAVNFAPERLPPLYTRDALPLLAAQAFAATLNGATSATGSFL